MMETNIVSEERGTLLCLRSRLHTTWSLWDVQITTPCQKTDFMAQIHLMRGALLLCAPQQRTGILHGPYASGEK